MSQPAPSQLKIALAQANPTVGDIDGNIAKLRQMRARAASLGADVVVFPELFVTGYPPEDLVLKPAFPAAARASVEALAADLGPGPAVLTGTVWPQDGHVYNAVVLLDNGAVEAVRFKVDLPNYGVFDEKRVFMSGPLPGPVNCRGVRLGVPICEDIWGSDVVECLAECGAEILITPNGSPFDWTKPDVRMNIAVARVVESGLPLVYVNQVGGQDELVFDGASFVLNADKSPVVQLPAWEEKLALTEWRRGNNGWLCATGERAAIEHGDAAAYQACMLGVRDYVDKNGFPGVILGLSGGVDSALVAAISVDALGPARVRAVMMPYRYTSEASVRDASACAKALGLNFQTLPIEEAVAGITRSLASALVGTQPDTTEENIQARARGVILMALSNKFGGMVITTGNKSEMSVGYATLYGDMNGGFNPVKDLYKMEVYRLARWRNAHVPKGGKGPAGEVIPEAIITKVPTAELRPNQTDQDSLPPYAVLDDILACLVEKEMPLADIVARGHPVETVKRIERLLYLAEYKRRQAPPGVKISSRNFGRDRRYPIVNKFREPL
ncbi:MAG: NAD+ synthase [Hyphomicrobium sp.]|uniref:NAD+ synthase n=1 Tax=Hyphomicrobium sp. TaxID=82 RepID=UPI00132137D7|nr:NAD+ synthase [Hyphomicrobium sp.]KAB2940811.1 MAG: NAD+ synthase [Hyphomicrobium sp.]MBZ0209844.1 NAD+ synthase [Hyphomicrobium sp.]